MTDTSVIHIAVQTLLVVGKLAAPILIVSVAIGFAVSMLQAATQINEMTLTFVPKLLGVAVVIVMAGHWMLGELTSFTRQLFAAIPGLIG